MAATELCAVSLVVLLVLAVPAVAPAPTPTSGPFPVSTLLTRQPNGGCVLPTMKQWGVVVPGIDPVAWGNYILCEVTGFIVSAVNAVFGAIASAIQGLGSLVAGGFNALGTFIVDAFGSLYGLFLQVFSGLGVFAPIAGAVAFALTLAVGALLLVVLVAVLNRTYELA